MINSILAHHNNLSVKTRTQAATLCNETALNIWKNQIINSSILLRNTQITFFKQFFAQCNRKTEQLSRKLPNLATLAL